MRRPSHLLLILHHHGFSNKAALQHTSSLHLHPRTQHTIFHARPIPNLHVVHQHASRKLHIAPDLAVDPTRCSFEDGLVAHSEVGADGAVGADFSFAWLGGWGGALKEEGGPGGLLDEVSKVGGYFGVS